MSAFTLNEQVNVESRTWPGINKPGGVGKIVKIHSEGTTIVAVDVKYALGGVEKNVELQYVKRHHEIDRGGRSRSRRSVMNLGEGGEEEGSRRSAKPKRSAAAAPGAAKNSEAKKGTNDKGKASSGNTCKRKTNDDASRKACKAKKKVKVDGKKKNTAQAQSSAILPSDSDSVVVSADESELTAPSYKPVLTKKATAKKSSSKAATTTKRGNVVPEDKRPPIAASVAKLAPAASQAAKPMPKLKKADKNASAVTAGGSKVQATLQKVHESNSRAASSFVDDVVGDAAKADAAAAAADDSASDDASTVIVGDDQSTIGGNTHSSSASLTIDTQRRQLFCTKLNEVMIKRMVEEMSIADILAKVNADIQDQKPSAASTATAASGGLFAVGDKKSGGTDPTRSFTNLEIRSYLNELDRQQKIMVTWDTGTVYRI